jgi:16S rRNA (cytosine1402-N4)-methyltransferase
MDTTFQHIPVLLEEVIDLLNPVSGGTYCDATLGGGSHAERILEQSSPDGRLVGIDRDLNAIKAATKRLSKFGNRVSIYHGNFSQLEQLLAKAKIKSLDGLLLDLGVSSHQLDEANRGFSFMKAGPLDMRMDNTCGESAQEMLSRLTEDELADIIYKFGEERLSRRIARSIKKMEAEGTLSSTKDLAFAIRRVAGKPKPGKSDIATKTFQAIRIAVNDEMGELERLLELLPDPIAVGGTVAIITFHSLEDKMVKRRFDELVNPCKCPPGLPICNCPKPVASYLSSRRRVKVSKKERESNRRARSAKVRSIRRIL